MHRTTVGLLALLTPPAALATTFATQHLGAPLAWVLAAYVLVGVPLQAWLKRLVLRHRVVRAAWLPVGEFVALGALAGLAWASPWIVSPALSVRPLERIPYALAVGLSLALLAYAVVMGFFAWLACGRKRHGWRFWLAVAGLGVAGWAVAVGWIAPAGSYSLATDGVLRAGPASFFREPVGWVYSIRRSDGEIWRVRTDGTERIKVADPLPGLQGVPDAYLSINEHGLLLAHDPARPNLVRVVPVDPLPGGQSPTWRRFHPDVPAVPVDGGLRATRYLLPVHQTPYTVFEDRQSWTGLRVVPREGEAWRLAWDSPILSWRWRSVSVLPNDFAVAEFGPQVVIVDLRTREIAWLADGAGPAVQMLPGPPPVRRALPWEWFLPEAMPVPPADVREPTKVPPFPTRSRRRAR